MEFAYARWDDRPDVQSLTEPYFTARMLVAFALFRAYVSQRVSLKHANNLLGNERNTECDGEGDVEAEGREQARLSNDIQQDATFEDAGSCAENNDDLVFKLDIQLSLREVDLWSLENSKDVGAVSKMIREIVKSCFAMGPELNIETRFQPEEAPPTPDMSVELVRALSKAELLVKELEGEQHIVKVFGWNCKAYLESELLAYMALPRLNGNIMREFHGLYFLHGQNSRAFFGLGILFEDMPVGTPYKIGTDLHLDTAILSAFDYVRDCGIVHGGLRLTDTLVSVDRADGGRRLVVTSWESARYSKSAWVDLDVLRRAARHFDSGSIDVGLDISGDK